MSAVKRLREKLSEECLIDANITSDKLLEIIDNFIDEEQKTYTANTQKGALTFGRYKGFLVSELSNKEGRQYLDWLSRQSFFTPDKFGSLYDSVKQAVKKNPPY